MAIAALVLLLTISVPANACLSPGMYAEPASVCLAGGVGAGLSMGCPGCPGCPDNPVRDPNEPGCY
jgi:hypothetical protein